MARTDSIFEEVKGSHVKSVWPTGRDLLINGENRYLTFGRFAGSDGYGIRDNNGILEFRNELGEWNEFISSASGSVWGSITGDIEEQEDLQNELALKSNIDHSHNINDVNNLQSTLDDKANKNELFSGDYLDLINRPNLEALDNVDTFPTRADFPEEGSDDRFYIAADTNSSYRWNGTDDYVTTNGDLALGETPQTAYRGDRGKIAYDHSQTTVGNPHKVSWDEIEGELENPENPQDPAPKSYVDANAGTTKQYFSSSEEKTDTLTPSSESAEETFTLSSDRAVQKVILNRLVLLDDEWTQDGTSLTVSPDAGFETTDKIVVYQQSLTAANAVGASDYIDLISNNGTIHRLTVNDDGNVITTQQ